MQSSQFERAAKKGMGKVRSSTADASDQTYAEDILFHSFRQGRPQANYAYVSDWSRFAYWDLAQSRSAVVPDSR
jgi:hypothetical protein